MYALTLLSGGEFKKQKTLGVMQGTMKKFCFFEYFMQILFALK